MGTGQIGGPPGSVGLRQRRRFNDLWNTGRRGPNSDDLIRYRVWSSKLVEPVVEIGSGDGLFARTFQGVNVLSVDQSMTGLRQTPDPRVAASIDHLPFRAGFARTVVAAEVLEHTEDPVAVLRECRRIAAPGATLMLSVPTMPVAVPEALFHRARIHEWPSATNLSRWDPEHERRYTDEVLVHQIQSAGWDVVERIPLFGSTTTALFYFAEPLTRRLLGRNVQFAHHGAAVDRLVAPWDRHSCLAVISTAR